jgi:signal peptidase I
VSGAGGWVLGFAAAAAAGAAATAVMWVRRRYLTVAVLGSSMEPALYPGERVLVRRCPLSAVRPGDLVVFEDVPDLRLLTARERADGVGLLPEKLRIRLVKRAAAVPGDRVPLDVVPALGGAADEVVPAGSLVVLGDNPAASTDSRDFGYVAAHRLLGVVLRKL